MGISTGTQLFISVRFYQSLFSDEGYLAFTLPVTPGQHLLARTLVGGLWALIDTVILMALLTYLGLTALFSVIVLLTSVLSGTLPNTIGFGSETTRFFTESYSQTEYFLSITKNSLILAIVQAVIAYVITHYILSKKINLN